MQPVKPNSLVRGEVVRVAGEEVWIEVDFKSRAAVPLAEFYDEAMGRVVPPRLGAIVAVLIESIDEKTGAVALSYRKARRFPSPGEALAWRRMIEGHVKPGNVVAATVRYRRGGGLAVTFAFRVGSSEYLQDAGLPTSELCWPEYADYYVGHTIRCVVLQIDTVLATVVVSERKLHDHGDRGADEGGT